MTSEGHPDQQPTSGPYPPGSLFEYEQPPPPAPYGYPPTEEPTAGAFSGSAAPPAPEIPAPAAPPAPEVPAPAAPPAPEMSAPAAAVGPPSPSPFPPPSPMPSPTGPGASAAPEYGGEPSGPVRRTAAVPPANRAAPTDGIPPQFTPQPRVYQTAAGPPQPVSPPLPTRSPGGTPLPTRTPGQTPLPDGGGAPGFPPASPPFPPRPRQPEPDPYESGPPEGYQDPWHPEPAGAPDLPPLADQPPPTPPPPPEWADPNRPGLGLPDAHDPDRPAPSVNGYDVHRAAPEPPAETAPEPSPPAAAAPEPAPERSGPPTGLIVVAALLGAALLVLAALSIPYLAQVLSKPDTDLSIGECVVRDGDGVERVDCATPGAYEIVASVSSRDECPDQAQPTVQVPGPPATVYCLAPAGAADEAPGDDEPDEAADETADES